MNASATIAVGFLLGALAGCDPGQPDAPAGQPAVDGLAAGWSELDVVGIDYAFQSADTVPAGPTVISFRNNGSVRHELKLIGLRAGSPLRQVIPLAMIDSGWAAFREPTAGILTADPGRTTPGRLLVHLEPGRTYLLVCAFADSDTAPLHSELGMIRVLQVR